MEYFWQSVELMKKNNQKQDNSVKLLFQEINYVSQHLSALKQVEKPKAQSITKKKLNLLGNLRYELVMEITLFLNTFDILKLRRLDRSFNKIILQSLPKRIIIYKAEIQNLEEQLTIYPEEKIENEIRNYQDQINIIETYEDAWNIKEISKIYASKTIPEPSLTVLKLLSLAVLKETTKEITYEKIVQVVSRPYLMYDIPELRTLLSQEIIEKLKAILEIDLQQVEKQSRFCKYICENLQTYVIFCGTTIYQQRVKNFNLKKRLNQFQQKLKVFEKLNNKYHK